MTKTWDWTESAGGTSAYNPEHHGYSIRTDKGEYHIWVPTDRRGIWHVTFANTTGKYPYGGGLWIWDANARSARSAKQLAKTHYEGLTTRNPIKDMNTRRRAAAITRRKKQFDTLPPRFANVTCSQCGGEFGPGNEGFSHCADHQDLTRIREHARALSSRKKDTRDMQEQFLAARGLTVEKAKRLTKAGRDKLTRYYKTWLAMQ